MTLHSVLDRATWAARHPLSATAHTVGVLKGAATVATELVTRSKSDEPVPEAAAPLAPVVPVVPVQRTPAAEQRLPEPPHESFVTEPSAVSRDSAHGGHGTDAELDDWYGELEADDVPEGVVASLELGDGAELVDHAAINAELSRSEVARRGAERDPG